VAEDMPEAPAGFTSPPVLISASGCNLTTVAGCGAAEPELSGKGFSLLAGAGEAG
jgi:hypothetical protein